MKACFALFCLLLFACAKEKTSATSAPPVNPPLYIFRATGFTDNNPGTSSLEIDTAKVYVNGTLRFSTTYAYNQTFSKGDTLSFYFSGFRNLKQADCNFAIWKNENKLPSESIRYTNCLENFIYVKNAYEHDSTFKNVHGGDSVTIHRIDTIIRAIKRAIIKGKYLVE